MESEVHFLKHTDLPVFLGIVASDHIYGTVSNSSGISYDKLSRDAFGRVTLGDLPPIESIKSFMFPAREQVAVYPQPDQAESLPQKEFSQTIAGARACDISALDILDKVFINGDYVDPFYEHRRRQTVLITTDCVKPAEYCFCNLLGGKPFPEQGFDINFSPVQDGYLVQSGSSKGDDIIAQAKKLLTDVAAEQLEQRQHNRQSAMDTLKEQNQQFEVDVAKKGKKSQFHLLKDSKHNSANCVECGACSYICPTCHCFFLFDQRGKDDPEKNIRLKTWDSCIMANFAKMGGEGAKPTPRPELRNRFENRVRHKFEWMVENLNVVGCVGCGRCEAACMGGSDIRGFLKEIAL